jgi:tRNA(Ile)-lysidine synthase
MGRARCAVEAALLEFLRGRGFGPDDDIAVAYSGGPDSTALLLALSSLGWKPPIAVHVDHGIRPRPELEVERALVRATCSFLELRLILASVRPGAVLDRAKSGGEGVEAEARRYRYRAFRGALERCGARALLLAHTRDDQAETILMRLFGGSGGAGLRGIPEANGPFLRPFLGVNKASLLAYLEGRGVEYSMDSTNASEDYLRNRIRGALVPALDSCLPGWRAGLAHTAAKAARDEAALSAGAEALAFAPSRGGDGELSVDAELLLKAPEAIARRSLLRAAGRLLGKARLSSGMASAALRALRRGEGSRYRGAGLELRIREGRAILRGGLDFPKAGGYFVLIDRPCRIRVGPLEVRAAWDLGGRPGIRADAFRFPLVVRSRRPGDSIALKDGTKRLDALFSEWALPEDSRRAAAVVEDRDGIVAVLGAAFGGKDRFRARHKGEGPEGERPSAESAGLLSVIVKGA